MATYRNRFPEHRERRHDIFLGARGRGDAKKLDAIATVMQKHSSEPLSLSYKDETLTIALFVGVLWILLFTSVRSAFAGIFQQRVQPDALPAKRHTRVVQEA